MVFGHWACGKQAGLVADLGMAFVDDWVRGTVIGFGVLVGLEVFTVESVAGVNL